MGDEMTESERADEGALVLAVRAGDGSFAALYRHFERPLLGFFMRATGKPDLAADLTAETFASVLESIGRAVRRARCCARGARPRPRAAGSTCRSRRTAPRFSATPYVSPCHRGPA